jgi:hypothetical protein
MLCVYLAKQSKNYFFSRGGEGWIKKEEEERISTQLFYFRFTLLII